MSELGDAGVVEGFVSFLADQRHPGLRVEARPDVDNRNAADIDAVAGPLAIEHTSIDTRENQRRDGSWFRGLHRHLKTNSVIASRFDCA
jgi:hypothetical protein